MEPNLHTHLRNSGTLYGSLGSIYIKGPQGGFGVVAGGNLTHYGDSEMLSHFPQVTQEAGVMAMKGIWRANPQC